MKEDFKNKVKNTAEHFSDDINPDLIWAGIETKMNKKNRVSGYWIFGGLSLVVVSLFFAWSLNDSAVNSSAVMLETISDNNKEEQVNIQAKQDANKTKRLNTKASTVDKINHKVNEAIAINKAVTENKSTINNKTVVKTNNKRKEILKDENTEVGNIKSSFVSIEKSTTKNIAANNIALVAKNNELVHSSSERNTTLEKIDFQSFDAYANTKNETLDPVEHSDMRAPIAVAKVRFGNNHLLPLSKREINIPNFESFKSSLPSVAAENKLHLFSSIEIYGGLSYGDKTVSGIDQSYAKIRNDSEDLLEQWSTGVNLEVFKLKDFRLRSGVRFSMITDRLLKTNQYLDQSNYSYIISRLEGDAIVIVDDLITSDSIPFTGSYTIEQYNSQRIISIPLEVTFGKSFNSIDLGVGFGVDVNYQLKDTHVILNEDGDVSVNNVGGKWVNPSLNVALSGGYHINDTWSIISRLNFRQIALSDHETISTLTTSYKLYGLELGVRKEFGK